MADLPSNFGEWLSSAGLGNCAAVFEANDIGFDNIEHLSDSDLTHLGLSLGHRRTLQAAVARLHPQGSSSASFAHVQLEQGERRQITVMFCDLVGSTELSMRLDPEDLRSVIHDYYTSCCNSIEESGGFIARLVGDGILAYFGYPSAREDAAECAVRAGLRLVDALRRGQRTVDAGRIDVRIGIATGVSVVSDMVGVNFSELHAVVGSAPNLASRIQGVAEPGTVAIADETRRLAGNHFLYLDRGTHAFKGFERPVHVWTVASESCLGARFDAQHSVYAECIGRAAQLQALEVAWAQAQLGNCQVVAIVGEAGIGKSRLLRTASERLALSTAATAFLQCSPSRMLAPLHPVIDWLRRDTRVDGTSVAGDAARLQAWLGQGSSDLDLVLVADLLALPLPSKIDLPHLPPDRKMQLTRELVIRHFERNCASGAALLMVEDAHWMDGATVDFLRALFARLHERPVLAIVTSRPGQCHQWSASGRTLALQPLEQEDAERLVRATCRGRVLPPAVVRDILDKTDGVPLFIEELTTNVIEAGVPHDQALQRSLDIPTTLRDSLMARLDRMNDAKHVARVASALGREFSFALLEQVSQMAMAELVAALDRLVEAQLLFQQGTPPTATYVFKHSLVQQAAYESQLRSDRQVLHARIVDSMEAHRPDLVQRDPGLLAHHCELAGLYDREVDYLYAAGVASTRLVAVREALSYFERADAVLAKLEPTPRNATRNIAVILGLMEVGRFAILPDRLLAFGERARQLSAMPRVECDSTMTATILFQDGRAKLYSSYYEDARSTFCEIRQLGIAEGSQQIERKPASALAMTLCCQGLFGEMLEFIDLPNIDWYRDSGSFIDYIAGLGWLGYAHCQVGNPVDGERIARQAIDEAERVQSAIYLAGAYVWHSHALMALRQFDAAAADAERCLELSSPQKVPYLEWHALVFLALCQCRGGKLVAAANSLARARTLLRETGQERWSLLDYLPAIDAEIACFSGDYARAIACADEAIELANSIGGHFANGIAMRAKAVSGLAAGRDPEEMQAVFDRAMQFHDLGVARAEAVYSSLVWAHALGRRHLADRASRWVHAAQTGATRHGFELTRAENGAASMLGPGLS